MPPSGTRTSPHRAARRQSGSTRPAATAGIDSALVPGGSIARHATSGGKAVRGMCVYAQNVTQSQADGLGTSNRSGNYTIRGLNGGH